MIIKIIKYLAYSLLALLLIPLILISLPYFISPEYDFLPSKPFAGKYYYNPYQKMDSAWHLANFHAHSRSWGGLTNGSDTDIDSILFKYKQIGFSHIGISNYHKITDIKEKGIASIPAYEHGYNIKKRHHLCLGTETVNWLDFVFFQTLSHKQFVLNELRGSTDFLAINHPQFCEGFEPADFARLSNYDAIEVLNHYRTSIPHWDSALSAGYYAVLLANDDMHRLDNDEVGTNFTVVNTNSIERYDIIKSLKAGKHYGVKAKITADETFQTKIERTANLIYPQLINMQADTLNLRLNRPVVNICFTGQNGKIKKTVMQTDSANYVFENDDTYIRIEIEDNTGNLYLFNPIVRTDENLLVNPAKWTTNILKTTLKRGLALLFALWTIFWIFKKKLKTKKKS